SRYRAAERRAPAAFRLPRVGWQRGRSLTTRQPLGSRRHVTRVSVSTCARFSLLVFSSRSARGSFVPRRPPPRHPRGSSYLRPHRPRPRPQRRLSNRPLRHRPRLSLRQRPHPPRRLPEHSLLPRLRLSPKLRKTPPCRLRAEWLRHLQTSFRRQATPTR